MLRKFNKQSKLHIRKGDTVKVLNGEYRGNTGKVLEVDVLNSLAIVEGIAMKKKHTKPTAKHPNGGIVEEEAFVHISKLQVVDPKTGKATRVGRKLETGKDGKKRYVRFAKKSGEVLTNNTK